MPEENITGDWNYDEALELIAQNFDRFSKTIRESTHGSHPAVQAAQNAILAGYLRRFVEYLQGTYAKAPGELPERLRAVEEGTFQKVRVVSHLDTPKRMTLTYCQKCGAERKAKVQYRSVWLSDGPGPCAGTGEVKQELVEWCVSCDAEPPNNGAPIYKTVAEVYGG